jgi:hypothetical protein
MTDAIITRILIGQQEAAKRGILINWVIYDHPKDFPDGFIARRWEVGGGLREPLATEDALTGTLANLRSGFWRAGLTCLTRSPEDDPKIVETWL